MAQLNLQDISFSFQSEPLLDGICLAIEPGEKIGLVGRNGSGKSTLMRLIAGEIEADRGLLQLDAGLKIARLEQEVPSAQNCTVAQVISEACSPEAEDWQAEQSVERVLSRLSLDGEASFAALSSGMKRRCLLARAMVEEPNVLLFDEPTNHLDMETIAWLEGFLQSFSGTLIFVTHDRAFLQNLATRIVELDRGRIFDWECDYETFLKRKTEALEAEEKQAALFDKRLAQEEQWLRKGIRARRTRCEYRVQQLLKMREERHQRRERVGDVRMQILDAQRSGKLVIETNNVGFSYENCELVQDLTLLVMQGDRIGIMGPNGIGKTTLLRLLLKELEPTCGEVRHGTRLNITYFDQLREQLDLSKSVAELVGEGQETLVIGDRTRNIYGYLQDFLFTPEEARRPARSLSGGECNRLLLARLFKRPSNLLVLDEPTNDLDMETLELLEEMLMQYQGTLLVVSHDRAFLNNVATSILVLGGNGSWTMFHGGYDDAKRAMDRELELKVKTETKASKNAEKPKPLTTTKRLNYREQQEIKTLPGKIEALEEEQEKLHEAMCDPTFFQRDRSEIADATARLEEVKSQLARVYERWEELDARS